MTSAEYTPAGGAGEHGGRQRRKNRRALLGVAGVAAATLAAASMAAVSMAGQADASTRAAASSQAYGFTTLDNHHDLTFNQLLGIDNAGLIAGYFGIGSNSHPNKGYLLRLPYHQSDYKNENFPGSFQTQVTGLNDVGNTVGFWANKAGANFGFYTSTNGAFHEVNFPGVQNASPQMDQLLGINDQGIAVGFYLNKAGNNRGYEYNIHTRRFTRVLQPGVKFVSTTTAGLVAAGINNFGTVAGFYVNKHGVTVGFMKTSHAFTTLAYPGASATSAFGINDSDIVVGTYTTGSGSSAKTFGFTWSRAHGFEKIVVPGSMAGTTNVNGIDDRGELVGFYTDKKGNVDGFLARPRG
jgi:hypothetical protein